MTRNRNTSRNRWIDWEIRIKSILISLAALFFVAQGYFEVAADRNDVREEDPSMYYSE